LKRVGLQNSAERFFKNTAHDDQMMHQSVFSKKFKNNNPVVSSDSKFESLNKTLDDRAVHHLSNSFSANFR